MSLTLDQVLQLAPDAASIEASRKLQSPRQWNRLGSCSVAWWGDSPGGSSYQVKVERSSLAYQCNCPSRKFPCKHVLALLMVVAQDEAALPSCEMPVWVSEWLVKRQLAAAKKAAKATEPGKPIDIKAQQKRIEQREDRVREGLVQFDRWLRDLVRGGLAGLDAKGAAFWEAQQRRLIDAQAPGLAARLRQLSEVAGSNPDWPLMLLHELGKVKLLLHAFHRLDRLPLALVSDVRTAIGWTTPAEELEKHGDKVDDTWFILGQRIEEEDKLRVQRTWCLGQASRRFALVLQFAAGAASFAQPFTSGTQQRGTMLYYPSAMPQRAQFVRSAEPLESLRGPLAGSATIDEFLSVVADQLAQQPWVNSFPAVLEHLSLVRNDDRWHLCDRTSAILPLANVDLWKMFAHTGSRPVTVAGEWTRHCFRPLGYMWEGGYHLAL
jgi:hypothetical protein